MIIKPLEPYMLSTIHFEERDEEIKTHLLKNMENRESRLLAGIEDDRLIGVGGIWKFGYCLGEWGLWLAPEARKKRKFQIVRTCLSLIDSVAKEMNIHRLISPVAANCPKNQRFIEFLGFHRVADETVFVDDVECFVYERGVQ